MNQLLCGVLVLFVFWMEYYAEGTCPSIVSRHNWGARLPKSTNKFRTKPTYVVVHHSETPECVTSRKCQSRVRNIQSFHMDNRNWHDIGYNFLIGGDGKIYEGRGFDRKGAHVPRYNSRSIGVCLIGDFQHVHPPEAQVNSLKELISCSLERNKLSKNYRVIGHRQGKDTDCPGDKLYSEVKRLHNWDSDPS